MRILRCSCGETDPAAFYPSAVKRGKAGYCRVCQKAYYRNATKQDRDYFLKYQRQRRRTVLGQVTDLKVRLGCARCGEKHPAVLDFHHRDESEKLFGISRASTKGNKSWEIVEKEIQKCEVLCANCHRKKHFEHKTGQFTPWQGEADKRQKLA